MLTIKKIKSLFCELNEELTKKNVVGEIGICGGAVMCLVYNAREATKDVDGIFEPTKEIRKAAKNVAFKNGLSEDWLNDAAKAYFHVDPPKEDVMDLSNLKIWAPKAEYMLAMKAISARFDSKDKSDLVFLIQYMELDTVEKVIEIITKYYPKSQVPPKTQFLLEELFDSINQ